MSAATTSLTRRDFLKAMSAAALATLASSEPRPLPAAEAVKHPRPTADTCILLWMAGGMAAPETFDPKRYTPFEIERFGRRHAAGHPEEDAGVSGGPGVFDRLGGWQWT